MKRLVLIAFASLILAYWLAGCARDIPVNTCLRPSSGSAVPEPADLRSHNGVLEVDLTIHNDTEADGSTRYCYIDGHGHQSPTLRLKPGDLLILHLKNDLKDNGLLWCGRAPDRYGARPRKLNAAIDAEMNADLCASGSMTSTSTNLHFHGLTVPPVCHQDDVLKTSISPNDPPFEYRFRIPANEPPGLYWYHPHIHGFTQSPGSGWSVRRNHRRRNRACE